MGTFLRNTALFLTIQAVLLAVVCAFTRPDTQGYMAAGLDKRQRLHTIAPPRIILVGGSSVAFGYDSPRIQRELCVPVVNMGLHAGLGLDFMLSEVRDSLSHGDTVVLAPEYELFLRDPTNYGVVFEALTLDPRLILHFNAWRWRGLLDHGQILSTLWVRGLFPRTGSYGVYSRSAFNAWGDLALRDPNAPRWQPARLAALVLYPRVVETLNRFHAHCQARGARVFWVYPPWPESCFNLAWGEALDSRLLAALSIPRLNHPADEVYPADAFYDNVYHLNASGAAVRTERLIERFRAIQLVLRPEFRTPRLREIQSTECPCR